MFKIKKGHKKKNKGKKNKDSDIFTEEEYEEYKRKKAEEQSKQEEAIQEGASAYHSEEEEEVEEVVDHSEYYNTQDVVADAEEQPKGEGDWKSFFSATDSVLRDTAENLEHIKVSSYYQVKKPQAVEREVKKPPRPAPVSVVLPQKELEKSWVNLEKGGIDDPPEVEEEEESSPEEFKEPPQKKAVKVDLKPIEDLPVVATEDYTDVFDTTYVDTVESGEVQLFQIPELPTFGDPNEPDPFDTSEVNKVLHIEEVEEEKPIEEEKPKKKRVLVNLGCAVDVLTGKVETPKESSGDEQENEVNLLCESPEGDNLIVATDENKEDNSEEEVETKCALDDILFGGESDTELPEIVIPSQYKLAATPDEDNSPNKSESNDNFEEIADILDPLSHNYSDQILKQESHLSDLVKEFETPEKSEVETTSQPTIILKCSNIDDDIADEFDAEFAVLAAESVAKDHEKVIEQIGNFDDDDPFDTTNVDTILEKPKKEVDFAEEYLQKQKKKPPRPTAPVSKTVSDDPFDTSQALSDLPLGETEENLSFPETLQPQRIDSEDKTTEEFDPFDTSAADAFGKTELHVLEQELLDKNLDISDAESDFDFNPREDEDSTVLSNTNTECDLSQLNPDNEREFKAIQDTFVRQIEGAVQDIQEELFKSSDENKENIEANKDLDYILTTTYDTLATDFILSPQDCQLSENLDPFDTSIAEKIKIKLLEEELIEDNKNNTDEQLPSVSNLSTLQDTCQLEEYILDPFNTSHIKSTEVSCSENINNSSLTTPVKPPRPPSPSTLLSTTPVDENPVLLPSTGNLKPEEKEDDYDPFDTSIAEGFSRIELKVLEDELLTPNLQQIDNEFDPRAESPTKPVVSQSPKVESPCSPIKEITPASPVKQPCLLTDETEQEEQQLPPLNPNLTCDQIEEDFDPFNTSFAETLGKAEIKHLENELLSNLEGEQNFDIDPSPNTSNQYSAVLSTIIPSSIVEPEDPFDTALVDHILPIKQETKDIFDISPEIDDKPILQPISDIVTEDTEEIDPFDTSIAANLGKIEIKVLESELLSDDEFNPRS